MQRALLNFAEELIEAQDADAIQRAMAAIAASFGLKSFAYLAMPFEPSGRAYLISNYPREWTDHYLDQRYEHLDPVIGRARQTTAPFLWGFGAGDLIRSKDHERFFDEAAGSGIRCGATLPVHDSAHRIAAVTFASDRKRSAFERTIERERGILQFIAASLHVHVRAKLLGDPTFYMAFDPLAHIGTFNTPIFLIGATNDIDFEQGMFFNGMRSAGKPITYAVYEGDDHVPSDKNLTDYWWRILAYFEKC